MARKGMIFHSNCGFVTIPIAASLFALIRDRSALVGQFGRKRMGGPLDDRGKKLFIPGFLGKLSKKDFHKGGEPLFFLRRRPLESGKRYPCNVTRPLKSAGNEEKLGIRTNGT